MARFEKPSPRFRKLYASLIEGLDCEIREVFGLPCAFRNGQYFSGLYGDSLVVRLGGKARSELLRRTGTRILEPLGTVILREYVQLTGPALADKDELRGLVEQAYRRFARPARKKASARKPRRAGARSR